MLLTQLFETWGIDLSADDNTPVSATLDRGFLNRKQSHLVKTPSIPTSNQREQPVD